MQVQIGGLTPFTTIDYPGMLAAVLFLKGCPFRCVYCSNPQFLEAGEGEYDPEKIIEWLNHRRGKLEAVVFSGGEALTQGDVVLEYMKRIKDMGFLIGLHTNGFYPDQLKKALSIIDWVGLDIKTDQKNYLKLTGVSSAHNRVIESLEVLGKSGKSAEVRITCDPRFVSREAVLDIAKRSSDAGIKSFAVQKYRVYEADEGPRTNETERNQFFNDEYLKQDLNNLFDTVIFRE